MTFQTVPGTAQFLMRFTQQGQQVENAYNIVNTVTWSSAVLTQYCSAIKGWWIGYLKDYQSQELSLNTIVAKSLDFEDAPAVEYSDGLPYGAGQVFDSFPMNVTVAIKWTTGLAGRSFRGRTYHLGLVKSQVTGSTLNGAAVSNLTAAYSNLITQVGSSTGRLCVVSRYGNGVRRAVGIATPIIAASVDATTDSQRRRLPGRGA